MRKQFSQLDDYHLRLIRGKAAISILTIKRDGFLWYIPMVTAVSPALVSNSTTGGHMLPEPRTNTWRRRRAIGDWESVGVVVGQSSDGGLDCDFPVHVFLHKTAPTMY